MDIENLVVGFFPIVFYSKKGICDAFCGAFLTIPPFPYEPRPTRPTLVIFITLKLTPYSLQTQLYYHFVAVGSVDLTTDTFLTNIAIC